MASNYPIPYGFMLVGEYCRRPEIAGKYHPRQIRQMILRKQIKGIRVKSTFLVRDPDISDEKLGVPSDLERPEWVKPIMSLPPDWEAWAESAFHRIKRAALKRGIRFSLNPDDLIGLARDSGGRCQLSGIEFSTHNETTSHQRPWMPSVDRIDSAYGYTKENVRLVCVAVNAALGEWGDDVLVKVARGVLG